MRIFGYVWMTAAAALVTGLLSGPAAAQTATASLKAADGKDIGTVDLTAVPGGVLLTVSVKGLPPGEHALHVHAVGKCEPPFTTAVGHFNPDNKKHGLAVAEGHHAGDMPNLHMPENHELTVEVMNTAVTLDKDKPNSVFDADGSAIVIHANEDDQVTNPTGNSGARIACGVIEAG